MTQLSWADVSVDNVESPSLIFFNIKIDHGRVGVHVVLGKIGDDLCPVFALLNYLSRSRNKAGALFQWKDGTSCQEQNLWMERINPSQQHIYQ